jgi:hypothetical protein
VAGKAISDGAWIRPVNEQNWHAISESDLQLKDGSSADVLDVLTIPMLRASPFGHQTENHVIAPEYYWSREAKATWQQVVDATDKITGAIWGYGNSSFHGHNDKVPEVLSAEIDHSLVLIEPATLTLIVGPESQYGGGSRRRVRASFTLNGNRYNFVVTDPWIEARYFGGNDGRFEISGAWLCISLAEIINGSATKLVATVLTPDRARNQ